MQRVGVSYVGAALYLKPQLSRSCCSAQRRTLQNELVLVKLRRQSDDNVTKTLGGTRCEADYPSSILNAFPLSATAIPGLLSFLLPKRASLIAITDISISVPVLERSFPSIEDM